MNKGFSLVELSIVLVILGLLTGGILAGQNLIRASELRSVSTDLSRFQTATYTFRDKYFALPGDIPNAVSFWGAATTCPGNNTTPSTSAATCNGDGNGVLYDGLYAFSFNERYRYWQHLANAGMIEGTYTGVAASADTLDVEAGVNTPKLKLNNAGVSVVNMNDFLATNYYKDNVTGHILHVHSGARANTSAAANVFSTEEAWNIDTKLDDGKPGYGKVRTRKPTNVVSPNCATNTDPALSTYKFITTGTQCVLTFSLGF